jgi:hypothetical protein
MEPHPLDIKYHSNPDKSNLGKSISLLPNQSRPSHYASAKHPFDCISNCEHILLDIAHCGLDIRAAQCPGDQQGIVNSRVQ